MCTYTNKEKKEKTINQNHFAILKVQNQKQKQIKHS